MFMPFLNEVFSKGFTQSQGFLYVFCFHSFVLKELNNRV